jgi:hypothetical protein
LANEIKTELNEKGHIVRNIINVKLRVTKEPLPLFFVDLEPGNNKKEIYQPQFLQNFKIRVKPPRHKRVIAQCTWCHAMATQKPTAQSSTNVSNAEGHTILKVVKNLKTLHPHVSYATGDTLQATSCKLQATSCKLP